MIKQLFPEDSNQFNTLKSFFSSFKKDSIDRIEMFFPMWCMLAFQHYLVKSFEIGIFNSINITINNNYLFSFMMEDLIGIFNITFHTVLFLWLMKRFNFFGLFRTVKSDFQTNFLLFLVIFALFDIFLFGRMMFGFFLINVVLYFVYRSDSIFTQSLSLMFLIIALLFSINLNEPIIATSCAVYLPFLISSLIFKSKNLIVYSQKFLPLIVFIFISTKELWFGLIGLSYFLFFNMYYYFVCKKKYDFLRLDLP